MNISYNWLKDYVNFDLSPEELSAALTSIGLETGGIEEVQTIKGGLNGLVIGKVLTCEDRIFQLLRGHFDFPSACLPSTASTCAINCSLLGM